MSSTGVEAVELAAMAGLVLDPWQQLVLREALGEQRDGKWAAFEVGVVVARQNGKGGILEARELAGLFLLGERLIIHSAHQFDTALEAFTRLLSLVEDTPELSRRVARVSKAHGSEGIELRSGQRIRFRTRTAGGGRGFTADCLILDEAMILPTTAHSALLPTLSARPNPQVWYTGSAVDEEVHEHGVVLARVRERGLRGDDPRLAYMEWSADPELAPSDREAWAQANPGLGIRIDVEHVAAEHRSMLGRQFEVERLSIGHWPRTDDDPDRVIPRDRWDGCRDEDSAVADPVTFAVDVTPDRDRASVCVAGLRGDGGPGVEVVRNDAGTAWVVEFVAGLQERHDARAVVIDPRSPAATLIDELLAAKVRLVEVTTQEYARACGSFYDLAMQGRLRHRGQGVLERAVAAAAMRPLGEAWAWSRRALVDISPLVAATLALWGALRPADVDYARVAFASDHEPTAARSPLEDLVEVSQRGKGPKFQVLSQDETTVLRVPPRR